MTAIRFVGTGCLMVVICLTTANSQLDKRAAARRARAVMVGCEVLLAGKDFEADACGCGGEVLGVWDTGAALKRICAPHGVILNDAVGVVVDFIRARPERMDERFTALALEALTAAWPCK